MWFKSANMLLFSFTLRSGYCTWTEIFQFLLFFLHSHSFYPQQTEGWAAERGHCRWITARPRMGPLSFSHTHQHPAGTVTSCPLSLLPSDQWSWNRVAGRGLRFPYSTPPEPCSTLRPKFYWPPDLISYTASWQHIHLEVGACQTQTHGCWNEWMIFWICKTGFYHGNRFDCQNSG